MPDFREISPSRQYRQSGVGFDTSAVYLGEYADATVDVARKIARIVKKARSKRDYPSLVMAADMSEQLAEMLRSYVWQITEPEDR